MRVAYTPGQERPIAVTFVGRGRRWDLTVEEAEEIAGKLARAVTDAREDLERGRKERWRTRTRNPTRRT